MTVSFFTHALVKGLEDPREILLSFDKKILVHVHYDEEHSYEILAGPDDAGILLIWVPIARIQEYMSMDRVRDYYHRTARKVA